jgi:hypothetical protein
MNKEDTIILIPEFESFLKRNRLLSKFKREFLKQWNDKGITDITSKEFISKHDPVLYIRVSFVWQLSENGHTFWSNVNNKWESYLEDINNNKQK